MVTTASSGAKPVTGIFAVGSLPEPNAVLRTMVGRRPDPMAYTRSDLVRLKVPHFTAWNEPGRALSMA